MAKDFSIEGSALVITEGGTVIFESPRRDVYFKSSSLENEAKVVLYDTNAVNKNASGLLTADLSECTDNGTPFTNSSFRTFARENLGFNQGGGSPSGTPPWKYTANNYTDLTTNVAPTATEGELAIVYNSQGIWAINRKLKGVYIYQGGTWEYANQELQDKIKENTVEITALEADVNIKLESVTGDGVDNTDPINPVLSFPNASQVANAFDKSLDDASDINMASSSQTVQNKIVSIQNETNLNTAKVSADGSINTHSDVDTSTIPPILGQGLVWDGNNWIPQTNTSQITCASFISSLSQNVGTSLNGIGTNIQINLTNVLGPNIFGYNIASGNVIIPTAGWYKISYKCLTELFTNNRQNTSFVIKRNLTNVLGTFTSGYSRNNANDNASTCLSPFIPQFQFSAGDTIGLYAISAGDNNQSAFTIAQECVLTIEYLG